MKNLKLDHVNIGVKNVDQSVNWYRSLFGFEVVESGVLDGRKWSIVRSGDIMVCMYESKGKTNELDNSPGLSINHFAIRVPDKEEWQQVIEKVKPEILNGGVVEYPFSDSWYLIDPNGHAIEVVYWKQGVRFPQ